MTTNINNINSELTYNKKHIELRRDKVLSLNARGMSQQAIADNLGVSQSVVSLDLQYLSCKAQENIKTHIEERIPTTYQRCESGLNQVLQKLWEMSESSDDVKEKTQCYSIISNTYRYLKELSTDEATINKALEFIDKQSKAKGKENEEHQQQEDKEEAAISHDTLVSEEEEATSS